MIESNRRQAVERYVSDIITNQARINYKIENGKGGRKYTNTTILAILSYIEPLVSSYYIKICKNSSISGVVNISDYESKTIKRYFIENKSKRGYVKIDSETGEWSYTAKVGELGEDSFIVRMETEKGILKSAKITINILDKRCCEI